MKKSMKLASAIVLALGITGSAIGGGSVSTGTLLACYTPNTQGEGTSTFTCPNPKGFAVTCNGGTWHSTSIYSSNTMICGSTKTVTHLATNILNRYSQPNVSPPYTVKVSGLQPSNDALENPNIALQIFCTSNKNTWVSNPDGSFTCT